MRAAVVGRRLEDEVLRLDVAVHDALRVQVLEADEQVAEDLPRRALWQVILPGRQVVLVHRLPRGGGGPVARTRGAEGTGHWAQGQGRGHGGRRVAGGRRRRQAAA